MRPMMVDSALGRHRFIDVAFKMGDEICDAGDGYHFRVHLKSGAILEGVPEIPDGTNVLLLDSPGGIPHPVIPYDAIEFITVLEV